MGARPDNTVQSAEDAKRKSPANFKGAERDAQLGSNYLPTGTALPQRSRILAITLVQVWRVVYAQPRQIPAGFFLAFYRHGLEFARVC